MGGAFVHAPAQAGSTSTPRRRSPDAPVHPVRRSRAEFERGEAHDGRHRSPRRARSGRRPDLVQLLTPEGERREHPDYPLDITAERAPRPLPRPGAGPPDRRRGDRAAAPGRAGHLGLAARPGGRADRLRPGAAPERHGLPDLPRARRGLVPRRRPGASCSACSAASTTAAGTRASTSFNLYTIVIGSQTLHATGYAMGIAARRRARRDAVIAYFGDGATSQGDVNEAFVWASVFNAPVVFFCQNNQWAISEPLERQTRIPLYQRAARLRLPRRPGRRQRRARLPRGDPAGARRRPRRARARR